jgi:hypothetical protein
LRERQRFLRFNDTASDTASNERAESYEDAGLHACVQLTVKSPDDPKR